MHSLPQAPCRAINRDCMSVPLPVRAPRG